MFKDVSKFIGIPFVNGGRDFNGCDCWGLVKLVYKEMYNIDLPDYKISCFAGREINDEIRKAMKVWKNLKEPQEPCVVIMSISNNPCFINHCGVYIGNGMFLHSILKQNSHLDRLDHPFWRNKIKGFYAYV
jgi:cell wall-associated NlpC family hydrolase